MVGAKGFWESQPDVTEVTGKFMFSEVDGVLSEYFSYVNMVSIERVGSTQTIYKEVLAFYN